MRAMILAAGRGERLRPLTDRIPKVLAEVGGEPLLAHQLRWLASAGIREVVVNLHHLGQQIVDAVGDGRAYGVTIDYSLEPTLLETGGGVVKALPLLGSAPFVLLNGDIYTDFPFRDLPARPPAGTLAQLVVTPTPAFRERGDFRIGDGLVLARASDDGPASGDAPASGGVPGNDYVFCGIAVLDPRAVRGRPAEPWSLRDVYFDLIGRRALAAQVWDGYWNDIGTAEQLAEVNARHSRKP